MLWANFVHIYQPPDQRRYMMGRVVTESYWPLIKILTNNRQAKITLSIVGCLLIRLDKEGYSDVISGFRNLVRKGKLELTAGTMYHPFLPKLPRGEIVRQIKLNNDVQQSYFGSAYKPKGFYSPEAGYSREVAEVAYQLGYSWMVVDEIGYSGKLAAGGYDYARTQGFYSGGRDLRRIVGKVSGGGAELSTVDYTKLYQLRGLDGFYVHFRERVISDALASGQITDAGQFLAILGKERKKKRYLLTGTDGEAYGHHQPLLTDVLDGLYGQGALKTVTISELPDYFKRVEKVEPVPCTWGTSEKEISEGNYYARWHHIDNGIHDLQWQLTGLAIETVRGQERLKQREGVRKARRRLDTALYSCHYWWASARPWWSIELIERGARMLADVVALADGYEGGEREVEKNGLIVGRAAEALKLYQDIVFTAFDWLRTEKVADLSHQHS